MSKGEVICKICGKSIYRIFVEHIEEHLEEMEKEDKKQEKEVKNHAEK